MTLWRWIGRMIWNHPPPREAIEANALARRITHQADRLNDHLEQYRNARDPFAAIMADFYNRDQVDRIWRGPRHD